MLSFINKVIERNYKKNSLSPEQIEIAKLYTKILCKPGDVTRLLKKCYRIPDIKAPQDYRLSRPCASLFKPAHIDQAHPNLCGQLPHFIRIPWKSTTKTCRKGTGCSLCRNTWLIDEAKPFSHR